MVILKLRWAARRNVVKLTAIFFYCDGYGKDTHEGIRKLRQLYDFSKGKKVEVNKTQFD